MEQAGPLDRVEPGWAWAAFEPGGERPWSRELSAHLLRRAGFGPNWAEIEQALAAGPAAAVDGLLAGGPASPSFYEETESTFRPLIASGNLQHLPAAWLYVMLRTPHPLREKMTLFWHGHFATSAAKVTNAGMMYQQNTLLRRHALGPFRPLLEEAAKDPAMLIWLDSATNHKAHPNENFAREVMELFSLGLGHYTEHDIKEAARAFTGWEVRRERFWFNPSQHDKSVKTVLGRSGDWTGDDVIGILLEQPAAAQFIVRKLFRYLISDIAEPPDALIEPLAAGYRDRQYDTIWLLRTLLGSNLFYSPHSVGQKVKSPVEFAVGLLRSLEGTANTYSLADDLRQLGQGIYYPPNVKGWDGGKEWVNAASLLTRANLAWSLVSGTDGRYERKVPLVDVVNRNAPAAGNNAAQSARWLADLLIAAPLPEAVYVQLAAVAGDAGQGDAHLRLARVVHAIATLPEFQIA